MLGMSVCDQYREWARQAVEEWDGQQTHELFTLIATATGESPRPEFVTERDATENERHLLNLLTWREKESLGRVEEIAALHEQLAILREQLDVATTRGQRVRDALLRMANGAARFNSDDRVRAWIADALEISRKELDARLEAD